jgi:hypothetical protein
MMRGKITLKSQPVGKLCGYLADQVGAIVLDETGLEGQNGRVGDGPHLGAVTDKLETAKSLS